MYVKKLLCVCCLLQHLGSKLNQQAGRQHGSLASSGESVDFCSKRHVRNIYIYIDTLYRGTLSSNSDKNCRRRSILKKNHDVTIMTSSGHVTSSGSCPIDKSWPLSYLSYSFGTIPLSGFLSEIFSAKVATTIITWWRHQWCHKARINYPWGTYRHTMYRNILLKYRPIPTRIAGEAF